MRFQGRIAYWNDAKGIGTIIWHGSSDRVFVHISAFTSRRRKPANDDVVTYEVLKGPDGKFKAVNVSFSSDGRTRPVAVNLFARLPMVLTVSFVIYLAGSALLIHAHLLLVAYYVSASGLTLLVYVWDKSAARLGHQRMRERTLHLMSLLGGWPGAFAAQRKYRHKITKQSFQRVYLATVLINLAMFVWITNSPVAHTMLAEWWAAVVR